jgi:site-specific DNA recombinase
MTFVTMSHFYGYIRVSTAKQGEQGVSLQEQRDAISRYAERHGLTIAAWFEERETAAKRGRPVFNRMMKLLRQGKAKGVIIHKIDRSARNLKDWSDLGELIDAGIDVHFVNESLDLHTRGGRLSADIQAVVAADYIRNLREETRKGFYGRIKQGLYPLPAPIGYVDRGKAKLKEIDPIKGPVIRKAFELYGSGRFNLHKLADTMFELGLRNKRDKRICISALSVILNNPFYIGLIRLRRTKEIFPGAHPPLVSKSLFDRVQAILTGKTNTRIQRHDFLFRRLLTCKTCGFSLIGERQKGHIYYRCHTRSCATTGVREEIVEAALRAQLCALQFNEEEKTYFAARITRLNAEWGDKQDTEAKALDLRLAQLNDRLGRLTDSFLDGVIEKALFEERKAALLFDRKTLEETVTAFNRQTHSIPDRLAKFLELAGDALLSYDSALPDEKRNLIKILTSNRQADGKNLDFRLSIPFSEVAKRIENSNGPPYRDTPRTCDKLIDTIVTWLNANPAHPSDWKREQVEFSNPTDYQ